MPPRILRFRLRLMRFSPTVEYVPGKLQTTADALSRAPVGTPDETDTALISEIEHFTNHVLTSLPATSQRLLEIVAAQKSDEECTQIKDFCIGGWPVYMPHTLLLRQYLENRSHLSILDDLLLFGVRCCPYLPFESSLPGFLHLCVVGRLGPPLGYVYRRHLLSFPL